MTTTGKCPGAPEVFGPLGMEQEQCPSTLGAVFGCEVHTFTAFYNNGLQAGVCPCSSLTSVTSSTSLTCSHSFIS